MISAQPAVTRDPTIDAAKGLAIIAIVFGHTLRGLFAAGIVAPTPGLVVLDKWLYTWHLSVFAVLSGLFVARAVQRAGPGTYLRSRLLLFTWLYLLWTVIQVGVKLAVPSGVNSPTTWRDLFRLWLPDGQLWFLPWLAFMTVAAVITSPWRSPLRRNLAMALSLVVSLAAWGWSGLAIGTQGWGLLVFFMLGTVIGSARFLSILSRATGRLAGATALGALALSAAVILIAPVTPPSTYGESRTLLSTLLGLVVSGTSTAAILVLARSLSAVRWVGNSLTLCGRRSLEIFLAHILAAAGIRTLLIVLGVTNGAIHVVAGTIAGVVLPLVLSRISPTLRVQWLFELPRGPQARAAIWSGREPRPQDQAGVTRSLHRQEDQGQP